MYGEVWRTGGTKAQSGDQLDDYLEVRAAKVETNSSADSTSISFSCLKADFDDVFKVFDDLLRGPEFRADKLDLAQKEYFDAISRRNDDVNRIVGRETAKLAYGAQNPYARVAEYKTIAAVTRQDFIDWHRAHVNPNNIILGIVGDFDAAALEAKLRQAYGAWPKGAASKEEKIEFTPAKPGDYLVTQADFNQSSINMVGVGIPRTPGSLPPVPSRCGSMCRVPSCRMSIICARSPTAVRWWRRPSFHSARWCSAPASSAWRSRRRCARAA